MPNHSTTGPECGTTVLPVVYGLPQPELFEQAARGEVLLGGCIIGPDDVMETCECGATRTLRPDWNPAVSDPTWRLSLIHISEPTRLNSTSRMPSSA